MSFLEKYKKIISKSIFILILGIGPIAFNFAHAVGIPGLDLIPDLDLIVAKIFYVPMALCGYILGLAGVLLNAVLDYTVVNMSSNIRAISGINIAWATIRDLANMTFIFFLLYIAIGTVIGINSSKWKGVLVNIVIAAVLINFSMFMTKVVIDASNVFTLGIYRQIVPDADTRKGLSDTIMQPLGLTSLYNVNSADGTKKLAEGIGSDWSKIAIVSIGSSIFMIIVAFIFLAAAVMFIIRYITIIFLLILSPIAVLAHALPQFSSTAKKWTDQLTGQLTFAPVFMILMWVTLTIVQSNNFVCTGASWSNTLRNLAQSSSATMSGAGVSTTCAGGSIGLIINYAIVIGMAIASLTLSKSFSNSAPGFAQKAVSGALGYGAGAVAFGARRPIGWASDKALNSKAGLKLQSKEADSFFARRAVGALNKGKNGSFDVRAPANWVGGKAGLGDLGIGTASKGSYATDKKAQNEFFARPGSDAAKERDGRVRKANAANILNSGTASGAPAATVAAMQLQLNKMPPKEVEQLSFSKLKNPLVAQHISTAQFDTIMKSDKFTEDQKDELKKTRFNGLNTAITTAVTSRGPLDPAEKGKLNGLANSELELVIPQILSNPAETEILVREMRRGQIDDMLKSNAFTQPQKDQIKNTRKSIIEARLRSTPADLKKIDAKDLSQLDAPTGPGPTGTLTDPAVVSEYNPKILKRLGAELKDDTKATEIRNAILGAGLRNVLLGGNPQQQTPAQKWLLSDEGQASF